MANKLLTFTVYSMLLCVVTARSKGPAPPFGLQCDHNTVGLHRDQLQEMKTHVFATENPNPLLSWSVQHSERGARQKAFRVKVSTRLTDPMTNPAKLIWDTGIIASDQQEVTYRGQPLVRGEKYYWKVTWWDHNGDSVESVETGCFMAVTNVSWDGISWITTASTAPNSYRFMKTVDLTGKQVEKAVFYISGVGFFRAYVNDQDLHVLSDPPLALAPGWTNYEVRVGYMAFDVTALVKANLSTTIVVELGAGWRDTSEFPPRDKRAGAADDKYERVLRAQLQVDLTGGQTPMVVKTDKTWKVYSSKVMQSSIYNGEAYNAQTAHTLVGDATEVTGPAGVMYLANIPPMSQTLSNGMAMKIYQLSGSSKTQIVDFGFNYAGVVNISVSELQAGQTITIQHAEVLTHPPYGTQDGSLYVANLRGAKQLDTYTSDGKEQWYQPTFTYHGFRYIAITGYPRAITNQEIMRTCIRSDVTTNSKFNSSTVLLNQIQKIAADGQASNMMTIPTDCDQRDERLGWMGDVGLSADSMAMNFHLEAYFPHRVMIIEDEQMDDGSVPDVTPFYHGGRRPADPSWGAAYPQIVWVLMKQYGDTASARLYYPGLMKYLDFMQTQVPSSGIGGLSGPYGDWVPPPQQKKIANTYPSAFSLLLNIQQVGEMAKALNETEASANLTSLFNKYSSQFNTAFFDNKTAMYMDDLQISYALPLYLDIVPESFMKNITTRFINKYSEDKYHITAGIIGTKFILPVLSKLSQNNIAIQTVNLITMPSYGYMIHNQYEPATTVWELWNSDTAGPGMNSRNHHMFSSVSGWMQTDMIGFQQVKGTYGYKEMDLYPASALDLSSASIELDYPKPIKYSWQRNGGIQCGKAAEDRSTHNPGLPKHDGLVLKCGEGVITNVVFASYGNPEGVCGYQRYGDCHATNSMEIVKKMCLNKHECRVQTDGDFWGDPCPGLVEVKWLTVAVQCSTSESSHRELLNRYSSLNVDVSVPIQSTAHVNIPAYGLDNLEVWDGDTLAYSNNRLLTSTNNGVQSARWVPERDTLRLSIISGDYSFTVKGQAPNETHTVTAHGNTASHALLECTNNGNVISRIDWVSYGDPKIDEGGNPGLGDYHSHASQMIVENMCLAKKTCMVPMDKDLFFVGSRHQFTTLRNDWDLVVKFSCNKRF